MITDHQYVQFMDRLLADQRGPNRLMTLDDFEQSFLKSYGESARPSLWFTEKRAAVTDKLWRKHGPDLNFPHPLDTVKGPPPIPEADATGCQYLVRDDHGPQRHCNEPAVCRDAARPRLRYCQAHRDQVQRAVKGAIFETFNIQHSTPNNQ